MSILNNTTGLQQILEAVNNLPDAGSGGIELPKLSNPANADEIFLNKEAIDVYGNICIGTFTIDNEINTQEYLLYQLRTALNRKGIINEKVEYSENEDAIICGEITSYTNDRVKNIYKNAFYNRYNLTSVNFPACTSIGRNAFDHCSKLTFVDFPTCTSIGRNAFASCHSLTSVNFPACTSIDDYAFAYCYSLISISVPVCTNIGDDAFAYCENLTSISFPACTSIGSYAFLYCDTLSSLTFGASTVCTLANSNAFSSTPFAGYSAYFSGTPHIYVPASLVSAYQSATNWTYFSSYITAMEV